MPQKKKPASRSALKDLKPRRVSSTKLSQVRGGAPTVSEIPVSKSTDKSSSKLFQ